jgi:hypothetical protein
MIGQSPAHVNTQVRFLIYARALHAVAHGLPQH